MELLGAWLAGATTHRGAGPKAENDTSVLFILSLIFWGEIERMVFLDKEAFSRQLVSKSQRTPDSEGTSCSVGRRENPLSSRLFSEMQEFYTCVPTQCAASSLPEISWGVRYTLREYMKFH